jgi:glycosyltransferase EpsD
MKELIAEDASYQLLLVGPDEINGKYQRLAEKIGVSDHVYFLGFREDIPDLLQISDIAVSASKREGLPVNLIEAAMLKLPIVATDCRGVRDICMESGNHVMLNNDSAKKTNAKLEECLSVGDRFDIDLRLALELGMGGILVDGVEGIYTFDTLLLE